MMSVESSPVNNSFSLNWADIEVEDNPYIYEQNEDAFLPAQSKSSTTSTSTSNSSKKKKKSKSKSKSGGGSATAPVTNSSSSSTKKSQPPTILPQTTSTSTSKESLPTTTLKSIQPPSTKVTSSKQSKQEKVSQRQVTFTDITLSGEEDQKLLDQQKEDIELFFGVFGAVESIDSQWSESRCVVIYQHAADAKIALTQFKSVSKIEDRLTSFQAHRPQLSINLKNIWNIKAAMTDSNSDGSNNSSKSKPPKPSTKSTPPVHPPPPQRHHLFGSHGHPRSHRGEWRPTGFSRSQQQTNGSVSTL